MQTPQLRQRPCQQALSSRGAQASMAHQWPREVFLHFLVQTPQLTSMTFQLLLHTRVLEEPQSAVPSSEPHHSQLMGHAGGKSRAIKGLPSTPRQAQRSPATRGFGDTVAMALGCHGLSPLFLPAAPTLQPDPGSFSGSDSDPTGKGRDRVMRMRNGVHGGAIPLLCGAEWSQGLLGRGCGLFS